MKNGELQLGVLGMDVDQMEVSVKKYSKQFTMKLLTV
jgi:hypothetical protein